jgi:(R,R)-butanediol dehydrogenase/meso-butanediol dehydrogenase/diacetyl reductase
MGKGRVELVDDLPEPDPGPGQVVVRVKATAICGSERGSVFAEQGCDGSTGHETMGVVADPNGSRKFKEGDRVGVSTLQGCGRCYWCGQGKPDFCKEVRIVGSTHCEFVVSDARWLMPLPEDISDGEGVLVAGDGLGVPWGAAHRSGVKAGDTTCVLGCGPVGLGSIIVHRWLGARTIAVDINPERLKLAEKLGAYRTVNAEAEEDMAARLVELSGGLGPDVCIEAAGKQPTLDAAIRATKPEGTVVQCGHGKQRVDPQKLIIARNLRLMGNWICHFNDWPDMVKAIHAGLPAADLITAYYPLRDAQQAYDRFFQGLEGKVILTQ